MEYENNGGHVTLALPVFARIAVETARSFPEIVMITNAKGKRMRIGRTGRESLNFIEVDVVSEQQVSVRLCVILRFGRSIKGVAEEFGKRLRENVKELTGFSVSDITLVVTGVKSKNTARRQLEIKC